MKTIQQLFIALTVLVSTVVSAQTQSENYVKTTVYQTEVKSGTENSVSDDDKIVNINYLDGLGRAKQSIAVRAGGKPAVPTIQIINYTPFGSIPMIRMNTNRVSPISQTAPAPKDIITHYEYDALGRQSKQHLPFAARTNGEYKPVNILQDIQIYYLGRNRDDFPNLSHPNQINAYSETVYEDSPLNRVLKQASPGTTWQSRSNNIDHSIKLDRRSNTNADEVVYFSVDFEDDNTEKPLLIQQETYSENELYVKITKDENWKQNDNNNHTTQEFTDKKGNLMLKRAFNNNEQHDTYYVYDNYGNLTYVVPPKVTVTDGISTTELSELCYQYKYDQHNRLIEKKIPGKGWESIIYNKLDQPVMTQDANLKARKQWLFTTYDVFGRIAYTGMISSNSTRDAMQQLVDDYTTQAWVSKSAARFIAGTKIYYTNSAFSTMISEIHTINYYDDYNFDRHGMDKPATVYGVTTSNDVKGLPTGSKVRILGTNNWITTVTAYNDKAEPIWIGNRNHYLSTINKTETKLDFVGKPIEVRTTHVKNGSTPLTTTDTFTYDHMGRMLSHKQQLNGQSEELIASNTYDELGQLQRKKVGNTEDLPLQTVDYSYNIRGWLTGINDRMAANDLFSFKINYDAPKHGATALYNGNISETEWKTANDNTARWYTYNYDALNRITAASNENRRYSLSNVSYDKMGNIKTLQRNGHTNTAATSFGVMDKLSYTYDSGNKLQKVKDIGNKNYGFRDGIDRNREYSYDFNGNMTHDLNKGISDIRYNHLNLPQDLKTNNAEGIGKIIYIYAADGTKLQKIVSNGRSLPSITEYANNYVYKNGKLEFFSTAEGYAEPNGTNGFDYVYQYKDHLGNIRLSFSDKGGEYQNILASSFTNDMDGWQHNGAATSLLENGRVKVTVDSPWEGIKHPISQFAVQPGDQLTVQVTFDKGNTNANVRLYIQELDANGNHLSWNTLDGNLPTGTFTYPYTIKTGNKIYLRIDKTNTHEDQTTYFYVDEVKLSKGKLTILEEKNYYPFGLQHKGYNNTITGRKHNYGFGGKEEQNELGLEWIDITARNYDPALGRWMNIDPLAGEMRRHSPYNYAFDNPIYFMDPDGMKPFGGGTDPKKKKAKQKAKQSSPKYKPEGQVFSVSGTVRGKFASAKLGVSLGKDKKAQFSVAVAEASGTVTNKNGVTVKGKVKILSGSANVSMPGMGESSVSLSTGEASININENTGVTTEANVGVVSGSAKTANGLSVSDGFTLLSSNEDKNMNVTGTSEKLENGSSVSGTLSGNSVGLGLGIGPVSISASMDKDNASNSISNFFTRLADVISNGIRTFTAPPQEYINNN